MAEYEQDSAEIETKRRRSCQQMMSAFCEKKNSTEFQLDRSENETIKYLNSVAEEHKDWKREYKKRHHELDKTKAILEASQDKGKELDLSILSNDQLAFLNDKIDFNEQVKISKELNTTAIKMLTVTEKAVYLNRSLTELKKSWIKTANEYCIQNMK